MPEIVEPDLRQLLAFEDRVKAPDHVPGIDRGTFLRGEYETGVHPRIAGVRIRTRRVSRWRDAKMVKRWVASAFLATEKNFRKIMGYRDLWALDAILNGSKSAARQEAA